MVAVDGNGHVVGIMDTIIEDGVGTIDTVAIHPDHQRRGLGRQLLQATRERALATKVIRLDAWTRDDAETLAWYRAMGFSESDHYLHVYAHHYTDTAEPDRAVIKPRPGLRPIAVFLHGDMANEGQLRREFTRVHVCRRFALPI